MKAGGKENATRFRQDIDMNSTVIRNKTFTEEHFILTRKHHKTPKNRVRLADHLLALWFFNIQVERESFRIYSNKRSGIWVWIKILIFLSFALTYYFVCIMANCIFFSLLRCKTTNLNMFQQGRPFI